MLFGFTILVTINSIGDLTVDPILVIPRKIEKWAEKKPELAALLASEYGDALMNAYDELDVSLLYQSESHGISHIERTMLFGALIAKNEKLGPTETRDVLLCCSYHDIGRTDDRYDVGHGRQSAEKIRDSERLRSLFADPEAAMAAIHAHSIPDGEAEDAPLIYNVKDLDRSKLYTVCLKDADNIDRVRIYDLDVSFLRFAGTRAMVPLAWWVLDAYLKKHTVLCFGDSNTYGYNPRTETRYPSFFRYPEILQKFLGEEYSVVAEGLNGRTTAFAKNGLQWKSGLYAVETVIASHYPVDTLVIMLGTNDCAAELDLEAADIAGGMERLIAAARALLMEKQGYLPKIIIVCPPHLEESIFNGPFAENVNSKSLEVSKALPEKFKELAERSNCDFMNLDGVIKYSVIDSEHLRPYDHYRVAGMLADMIRDITD